MERQAVASVRADASVGVKFRLRYATYYLVFADGTLATVAAFYRYRNDDGSVDRVECQRCNSCTCVHTCAVIFYRATEVAS